MRGIYSFNPASDIPSQEGKAILITGANTGLGKHTALELAKHGPKHIFMASRNVQKGESAVKEVLSIASAGTLVSNLELDLTSFESIKKAVQTFLAASDRLDTLYLNAAVLGVPPALTKEGYEIQMGTNHVGHAALLKLLTPVLLKTVSAGANPRIVSVSSHGYAYSDPPQIAFNHLETTEGPVQNIHRYTQSKLANILYARQFASHHPEMTTVAITPGDVDTELFQREPADETVKHLQTEVAPKMAGPIEEGVKNHLWAGTNGSVENGKYYEPVGEDDKLVSPGTDDEQAKKLWEWTQNQLEKHGI